MFTDAEDEYGTILPKLNGYVILPVEDFMTLARQLDKTVDVHTALTTAFLTSASSSQSPE